MSHESPRMKRNKNKWRCKPLLLIVFHLFLRICLYLFKMCACLFHLIYTIYLNITIIRVYYTYNAARFERGKSKSKEMFFIHHVRSGSRWKRPQSELTLTKVNTHTHTHIQLQLDNSDHTHKHGHEQSYSLLLCDGREMSEVLMRH